MSEYMGKMWIARCRTCGDMTASAWADEGDQKEMAKSVARWIHRGDDVTKIDRHKGDPIPDLCQCKSVTKAASELKKTLAKGLRGGQS